MATVPLVARFLYWHVGSDGNYCDRDRSCGSASLAHVPKAGLPCKFGRGNLTCPCSLSSNYSYPNDMVQLSFGAAVGVSGPAAGLTSCGKGGCSAVPLDHFR